MSIHHEGPTEKTQQSGPAWSLSLKHLRVPNLRFLTFFFNLGIKGAKGLRQNELQDTLSIQTTLFRIILKLLSPTRHRVTEYSGRQTHMSERDSRLCFVF